MKTEKSRPVECYQAQSPNNKWAAVTSLKDVYCVYHPRRLNCLKPSMALIVLNTQRELNTCNFAAFKTTYVNQKKKKPILLRLL